MSTVIEPLRHCAAAPLATAELRDWPHRFGGANGCSVTATPLAQRYRVAWSVALPGGFQPEYLLAVQDRVLAVAKTRDRVLFARSGAILTEVRGRASGWCIAVDQGCLLGTNADGDVAAWEIERPERRTTLWGHLSDNAHRFTSEGDRVWVVAPILPRLGGRPPGTDIEAYRVLDLGDANAFHITRPRATPGMGSLKVHGSHAVRLAVGRDEVAVAALDGLHLFDLGMKPKSTIPWPDAELAPCSALATHEGGWAELRHVGPNVVLRLVTPEASPILVPLGSQFTDAGPPIPATGGHWMVISSSAMALVRPFGDVAWTRARTGPIGGIASSDARCQFWAEDHRVLAYDGTGGHVVAELTERLCTAPIMGRNAMFIASRTHVFALAPTA